jgi:hypothetical protein
MRLGSGKRPSTGDGDVLWQASSKEFGEEESRDEVEGEIDPLQELRFEYGGGNGEDPVDEGPDEEGVEEGMDLTCEEDVIPSKDEGEEEGEESKLLKELRGEGLKTELLIATAAEDKTTPLSPVPDLVAVTSPPKLPPVPLAAVAENAHPPLAETPALKTDLPKEIADVASPSAIAPPPSLGPSSPTPLRSITAPSSLPAAAAAAPSAIATSGPSDSVKNRASLFSFMPRKNPALLETPEAAVYSSNKPKIIPKQKMRQLHWIRLRPSELKETIWEEVTEPEIEEIKTEVVEGYKDLNSKQSAAAAATAEALKNAKNEEKGQSVLLAVYSDELLCLFCWCCQ